jgi:hypothetical protein
MDDAAARQRVGRFAHNVIGEIAPDPRQIAAPESFIGRACDRSVLGRWLTPPALHCALSERPNDSRADGRKGRAATTRRRC